MIFVLFKPPFAYMSISAVILLLYFASYPSFLPPIDCITTYSWHMYHFLYSFSFMPGSFGFSLHDQLGLCSFSGDRSLQCRDFLLANVYSFSLFISGNVSSMDSK